MDLKISMGRGRPLPGPLPDLEDYVVDFDGVEDPSHPYNWPFPIKYADFIHRMTRELLILSI
jgi:DHA1 family multidrug resistance protein-like MFS transporter